MKKRHRQYAGKALKDVTALNKCSACGNVKRAHLLCPYCVNGECFGIVEAACADFNTEIKGMFKSTNPFEEQNVMQKTYLTKVHQHKEAQKEAQRRKKDMPVDGSEESLQ